MFILPCASMVDEVDRFSLRSLYFAIVHVSLPMLKPFYFPFVLGSEVEAALS